MTSNKRNMLLVGALIAGSSASFACERTPQEAHNDGVEAQRAADKKIEEARQAASDKIAEANKSAAQAADDARREAAEAQAKANAKIREANRDVTGTHNEVRDWAQKKVDDVDNMIDSASSKAQAAAPKAKADFNNAIADVKQERDALQAEITVLETRAGDALDKDKQGFSNRVDKIKEHIRSIQKSL
jgi:colicin import membrane protein